MRVLGNLFCRQISFEPEGRPLRFVFVKRRDGRRFMNNDVAADFAWRPLNRLTRAALWTCSNELP